jgi:hypothetical protein
VRDTPRRWGHFQGYRRERQAAGVAIKWKSMYSGRLKGTTKAKPTREQVLRTYGLTIPEIASALDFGQRAVFRHLAHGHTSP